MEMVRKYLLVLGFAGVGLTGCKQHPTGSSQVVAGAVAPGEIRSQLPVFDVKDLQGREISSAELRGKVVLIDFWATWCQPCKKEMPGYQKLLERYGPRGFVVIGFKFDTMADTEDPLKFAHRIGVKYPLAIAPDELKQRFGGIEGLPTTMLYDRAGILRKKVVGFEYTEAFESAIKQFMPVRGVGAANP
jgi:thiol-disulfide isomerase/thioredoxin